MHITALLLLALSVQQQVPSVPLGAAEARSSEAFTSIFAVREMSDGRVLVTDNLDNAIRIVDLDRGTVRELGRRGRGPREYLSAHTILNGSGDTILVADNAQRRFVQIVNGEIVSTVAQPAILRAVSNFSAPLADMSGRVYFDVSNIEFRDAGMVEHDGFVIRWSPGASRLDTLSTLPVIAQPPHMGYRPFVFRSAWGLTPDGSVAVVTADPYRVTWFRNGGNRTGPTIAYERVTIDAAERDAERVAFSRRGRGGLRFQGRDHARESAPDPELRRQIPDDVFPRFKPPFIERRVLVSPAGEVWIPRAGRWNATSDIIDIVDPESRLVRRVHLPTGHRVVGFGSRAIYLAARDEFDLQWLERIPLHE
jgi:hypothetical protein